MAHRALMGLKNNLIRNVQNSEQRFKYLLILDFEATCEKFIKINPQELIEFPCIVVSTQDWQIKDVFHEYVKPKFHPNLTPFCSELTGIVQEMVDDKAYFPEIMKKFNSWIEKGKYFEEKNKSAFVTCGEWDLKVMIPSQCATEKLTVPDYFSEWINLKIVFCNVMKVYPHGIIDMLVRLNIPQIGRLHSGIDDVKNMINIIKSIGTKYNTNFDITSGIHHKNFPIYQSACK